MKLKTIFKFTFCISVLLTQEIPRGVSDMVKKSGISESDVKQLLKNNDIPNLSPDDNGFNDAQSNQNVELQNKKNTELINELTKDIIEEEAQNNTSNKNDDDSESVKIDDKSEQKITKNQFSSDVGETYFGYSTFKNNIEMFESVKDISVSPNHVIGPGDEVVIMLWGQTEDISNYVVSRDGYLFIPNIGQVFVNGLTLSKLEKKLKNIYQKAYSSLAPSVGPASTFFDVSLGSTALKPIKIFVMGEVSKPGVYLVKPSTSLFSSLYYFGGPKISGSLRTIDLIRSDKKITSIDFYDFLF